jgi:hypothetical protein
MQTEYSYNKKIYEYIQRDREDMYYNKFKRTIMKDVERKQSSTDNVDKYEKVAKIV